ncbi:hypothetical protein EV561_11170 [Rhizobium sp. BK376]|nr:hypothetical protein EV561_11170 [Rhizobium sp. BK376]
MDPVYLLIWLPVLLFLFLMFWSRRDMKKVAEANSAAIQENTTAIREHMEVLRQYLALKASETK